MHSKYAPHPSRRQHIVDEHASGVAIILKRVALVEGLSLSRAAQDAATISSEGSDTGSAEGLAASSPSVIGQSQRGARQSSASPGAGGHQHNLAGHHPTPLDSENDLRFAMFVLHPSARRGLDLPVMGYSLPTDLRVARMRRGKRPLLFNTVHYNMTANTLVKSLLAGVYVAEAEILDDPESESATRSSRSAANHPLHHPDPHKLNWRTPCVAQSSTRTTNLFAR